MIILESMKSLVQIAVGLELKTMIAIMSRLILTTVPTVAQRWIWRTKCGDALDIDIVNGVLAIGCFGCEEYTPVSELMKLHLNDAVPVQGVHETLPKGGQRI